MTGTTGPVFIVPCGNAKLPHAAPARDLYTGAQFRYVFPLADAAARRTGGEVFILSALHGLVEPDRVLEPYNKKMGDPGSVPVWRLAEQVRELGLVGRDLYALLARPYYEQLEAALNIEGGHAVDVFDVPTKTARGGRIQVGEQKTVAREFLEGFAARPATRPAAPARPQWLEDEYAYLDERFARSMVREELVPLLALVTEGDAGMTNVVAKTSDGRRWQASFDLSREALDARIESILGFDDFVRGMPMRNRTTTPGEVVAFLKARPHVTRIHLLGFGPAARDYVGTLKKLGAVRPDLDLTCDSVLLVAHRGKTNGPGGGPRRLTKAEDEYWYDELGPESFADDTGIGDYTEAISEVASWLYRSAREQLADRWLLDNVQRRAWLKDPESWLQRHYRDDPERPKHYELPQIAADLDRAWADHNFREKVVQRKRTGIQRAFGTGSGFVFGGGEDVDEG
jgi:hypothetical protein